MLVTLYLCSVNVYAALDAPKNRGFSYIDLWMMGTQLPICLALIEFGSLLCIAKYDLLSYFQTKVSSYQPTSDAKQPQNDLGVSGNKISFVKVVTTPTDPDKFRLLARKIDFVFFIVSTTSFFLFALVYWCTLL